MEEKREQDKIRKDEEYLTTVEKERRAVIAMLRIWIKKYPNEYRKVYLELQMFTKNGT